MAEKGGIWGARLRALNERVQATVREYGPFAVVSLLLLSVVNVGAFYLALEFGLAQVELAAEVGTGGTLAAAWVASRATKPVANVAALALTPLVARSWRWMRR